MNSEDLSSFIEEKRRQGDLWVDLSGKGLTELPRNIGSLLRLLHLDLSDNQLGMLLRAASKLPRDKRPSLLERVVGHLRLHRTNGPPSDELVRDAIATARQGLEHEAHAAAGS